MQEQIHGIRKFSPEWWNIQRARNEGHVLPQIYIVYNDYQIGWLYNQGHHFTDAQFEAYVYGLAITKGCKEIRFVRRISMNNKKIIKYAVIYF